MKKYFLVSLLLFGQLFSITPQKFGDYINLAVCVAPYAIALYNYKHRKLLEKNGTSENSIEEAFPYRLVGFGKYGREMITYLAAMFLSQKFLWSYSNQYLSKTYSNLSGIRSYGAYSLLGVVVGMISATIGVICAKGMKSVTAKYIFNKEWA